MGGRGLASFTSRCQLVPAERCAAFQSLAAGLLRPSTLLAACLGFCCWLESCGADKLCSVVLCVPEGHRARGWQAGSLWTVENGCADRCNAQGLSPSTQALRLRTSFVSSCFKTAAGCRICILGQASSVPDSSMLYLNQGADASAPGRHGVSSSPTRAYKASPRCIRTRPCRTLLHEVHPLDMRTVHIPAR